MPADARGQHPDDETGDEVDEEPVPPEPAEETLIAAVRRGDPEAVAELFRRHRPAAIRFASTIASPGVVEDVVSEAFERVFAALYQGGGPEAFRPYLFTTIRRVKIDMHRKHGREVAAGAVGGVGGDAPPPELISEDRVANTLDAELVRRAFMSLPERWRLVLWYTAVESRTMQETADLLGANANSIAVLGFRAREGLRNAYLAQHVGGERAGPHRPVLDLLPRWVRGGLPASKRAVVDEHLASCASCAAVADELAAINTSLGAGIAPLLLGLGSTGPSLVVGVGTVAGSAAHLVVRTGLGLWRLVLAGALTGLVILGGVVLYADGQHDRPATTVPTYPTVMIPASTLRPRPVTRPQEHLVDEQLAAPPSPRVPVPNLPSTSAPPPTTPTGSASPSAAEVDVRVGPVNVTRIEAASPARHLLFPVTARGPALELELTLHGVSRYAVHRDRPYGAWSCATATGQGTDLRTTCTLPAGADRQDFAVDVLPAGAATVSVRVSAVGVADPVPANNETRVVLPSS